MLCASLSDSVCHLLSARTECCANSGRTQLRQDRVWGKTGGILLLCEAVLPPQELCAAAPPAARAPASPKPCARASSFFRNQKLLRNSTLLLVDHQQLHRQTTVSRSGSSPRGA